MGQKAHPLGIRIGVIKGWKSRWFNRKDYRNFLEHDWRIRDHIERTATKAGVESVEITRPGNEVVITIRSSRPGLLIGRGGKGLEELSKGIKRAIAKSIHKKDSHPPRTIKVEVEEVRRPESYAQLVAKNVAGELERRMPFRRVMKQSAEKVMLEKGVLGVKISLAGRLGGGEYARVEHISRGTVPLATLRADVDYAHVNAHTTYGVIGVKTWIYRGEVFDSTVSSK